MEQLYIFEDVISAPQHYTRGGIETIDFIEAKGLNYRLGNCVKYISRAGHKDRHVLADLYKARWYLQREIEQLEAASPAQAHSSNTSHIPGTAAG